MTDKQLTRTSKFLSLVLRHKPETANVKLDSAGWTSVDALIDGCRKTDCPITKSELIEVVANNNKKRFEFNEDQTKIRASQGHSLKVDLQYKAAVPPEVLYHGTATRNLDSIKIEGLTKRNRHHVHLSADPETAANVGGRHGKPYILTLNTRAMMADGHEFYISTNGVWLTDHVPAKFLFKD